MVDLKKDSDGKVLRIFRPEIPNLIHLLQFTCVLFSGTGRSIFYFFAPKLRVATFELPEFIPKFELYM